MYLCMYVCIYVCIYAQCIIARCPSVAISICFLQAHAFMDVCAWVLGRGSWAPDLWILGSDPRSEALGPWISGAQGLGSWALGSWLVDLGFKSMDFGLLAWILGSGLWNLGSWPASWALGYGSWALGQDLGVCAMDLGLLARIVATTFLLQNVSGH